jgi:hypothetical protein
VEYFTSAKEALQRQAELEKLLISARGPGLEIGCARKESA